MWCADDSEKLEGYSADFIEVGNDLISANMSANLDDFRKVGVPEGLIVAIADQTHKRVRSSTNFPEFAEINPDRRSTSAQKVWCRLVTTGMASYDCSCDRFSYSPTESNSNPFEAASRSLPPMAASRDGSGGAALMG